MMRLHIPGLCDKSAGNCSVEVYDRRSVLRLFGDFFADDGHELMGLDGDVIATPDRYVLRVIDVSRRKDHGDLLKPTLRTRAAWGIHGIGPKAVWALPSEWPSVRDRRIASTGARVEIVDDQSLAHQ